MSKKYKVTASNPNEKQLKKKFQTIDDVFGFVLENDYAHYDILFLDNSKSKSKKKDLVETR